MSVEKAVGDSLGTFFFVVNVSVGQEETFAVVYHERIVGKDREVQQHLVHFRVAVAAYGNDFSGHCVQPFGNAFRVESFGKIVARSVVQDIAQNAEQVTLLFAVESQHFFQSRQGSVDIGYDQVFHI